MEIGLINPQQYTSPQSYRLNAPITLAYLLRRLADHGIGGEAIDLAGQQTSENGVLPGLDSFDAIGITAVSNQAEGARRLIKLIRYHNKDMYIACGGVDATLFPYKYLEWGASCVVVGEADGNVHEVFTDKPTGVVQGKPGPISGRPLWENHYPKPWEYPGHPHPLALPESMLLAMRGCPHSCTFCGNPYKGRAVRKREVEDVADEIVWLREQGVRGVFWYDDEVVSRLTLPYMIEIMVRAAPMVYRAQGRCDLGDDAGFLLRKARELGLGRVMWGVESFTDPVLKAVKKNLTVDAIIQTLVLSREAGIQNFVFLMTGMPGETPDLAAESREQLEWLLRDGFIQKVQITPCTPMPGTELYKQAMSEGWLFDGDPFQYSVRGGTPWMSQSEIADHTAGMRKLAEKYHAL